MKNIKSFMEMSLGGSFINIGLKNSKRYYLSIILLLIVVSLSQFNCFNKGKNAKGFYCYIENFDLSRIPLIEPFEITSADKGHSWDFKLPYHSYLNMNNTGNIEKVGIDKNTIILHNSNVYFNNKMTKAWFVILINKKEEKIFDNEIEFNAFVKKHNILFLFYDIKDIFQKFKSDMKLPSEWYKKLSINDSTICK